MDARFYIGNGGFRSEISVIDGELTDFWVHPMMRGRGWGTALIKAVLNWADKKGIELKLRIRPFGKRNIRSSRQAMSFEKLVEFYKKWGFRRINKYWMKRAPLKIVD